MSLFTFNERPLIANGLTFGDDDNFTKQSWVDEDSRRAYVVLSDPEDAKRLAKAFQHAVSLCGGKASPF